MVELRDVIRKGVTNRQISGEESVFNVAVPDCNYIVTRSGVFLRRLTDAHILRFSGKPKNRTFKEPTRNKQGCD
jgi:hypothetical protein